MSATRKSSCQLRILKNTVEVSIALYDFKEPWPEKLEVHRV
jgi:hypothetical protein